MRIAFFPRICRPNIWPEISHGRKQVKFFFQKSTFSVIKISLILKIFPTMIIDIIDHQNLWRNGIERRSSWDVFWTTKCIIMLGQKHKRELDSWSIEPIGSDSTDWEHWTSFRHQSASVKADTDNYSLFLSKTIWRFISCRKSVSLHVGRETPFRHEIDYREGWFL